MKTFFTLLLKGIGIALAVSLSACFVTLYWGNWRIIGWFVVILLVLWQIYKYMRSDVLIEAITNETGKVLEKEHYASIGEKISELVLAAFLVILSASCFFGFGLLEEWLFNESKAIFELTILRGIALLSGIILCLMVVCLLIHAVKKLNLSAIRRIFPVAIKWIIIVAISGLVALGIFRYLLPPINW